MRPVRPDFRCGCENRGWGNSQYEPFGALDAKVRKELRQGLREIHDRTGLTTVFVTHDQEEAMELADLVVVMSMGRIE
jgi:sulfate transport system ATP-binding protein